MRHPSKTPFRWELLLIFLLALLLRTWHLQMILPSMLHHDEVTKTKIITRILAGQSPDYLQHPGLLINSAAATCALARACGIRLDPPTMIYLGRLIVAILGALSIFPAAWIATLLAQSTPRITRFAAAVAALLLAALPLHALHSRYLKEDIHLTFCVLLCVGATLHAWKCGAARRAWLIAFALAGACFASKYVGIAMLPMVAIAYWLATRNGAPSGFRARILFILAGGATAFAVFVIATPQLILFPRVARRDFGVEFRHGVLAEYGEKLPFMHSADRGVYYVRYVMNWSVGWPLLAAAALALLFLLLRPRRSATTLWLAGVIVLWYFLAEGTLIKRQAGIERYVLPCAALLLPVIASAFGTVFTQARRMRIAASFWCFVIGIGFILNFWTSYFAISAQDSDSRQFAAAFITTHLPPPPVTILQPGIIESGVNPDDVGGTRWLNPQSILNATPELSAQANVLVLSHLVIRRFENFPELSSRQIKIIQRLRAEFPYVQRFEFPAETRRLSNNPILEVRSRTPWK